MSRHCLTLAILAFATTLSHAQPSLPSSFQAKTVHSPKEPTSLCAGEELGLWSYFFTDMPKTATHGLL
jgi:hypothetical protein